MSLVERVKRRLLRWLLPPPAGVERAEPTFLLTAHDDPAPPNDRLLDVALAAVAAAREVDLSALTARLPGGPAYPEVWPGEHYQLLTGLVRVLAPQTVVEIGTGGGLSALAMLAALPEGGQVTTFDLVDWREHPDGRLVAEDFADGRLVQCLEDLTDATIFARHRPLLERAELVFIDGAKDGVMEPALFALLDTLHWREGALVMLDDIKFATMLGPWRALRHPKLDLTSFGHWSGTGLVDWKMRDATLFSH